MNKLFLLFVGFYVRSLHPGALQWVRRTRTIPASGGFNEAIVPLNSCMIVHTPLHVQTMRACVLLRGVFVMHRERCACIYTAIDIAKNVVLNATRFTELLLHLSKE